MLKLVTRRSIKALEELEVEPMPMTIRECYIAAGCLFPFTIEKIRSTGSRSSRIDFPVGSIHNITRINIKDKFESNSHWFTDTPSWRLVSP